MQNLTQFMAQPKNVKTYEWTGIPSYSILPAKIENESLYEKTKKYLSMNDSRLGRQVPQKSP